MKRIGHVIISLSGWLVAPFLLGRRDCFEPLFNLKFTFGGVGGEPSNGFLRASYAAGKTQSRTEYRNR